MSLGDLIPGIEACLAASIVNNKADGFWGETRLREIMSYGLLSGGKRLRPLLVLESALLCAPEKSFEEVERLARPALIAIEYIHSYSLIHDDLPAMDNDDWRRGKPSCHKKFSEGEAILAGDALLTEAFGMVAGAEMNAAAQCLELAQAGGASGMVAGQVADIARGSAYLPQLMTEWLAIHERKSARLISCACVLGALSVGAHREKVEMLRDFGTRVGLAFQLQDDLLDNSPITELISRELIRERAELEIQRAESTLISFGSAANNLNKIAQFALNRNG